jgi:hypothetical protein
MPEHPTPTPPLPAEPKRKRASPGDVSQRTLANIKLAEDVTEAATDPDHKDKLADEELPASAATDLEILAGAVRNLAGKVAAAKKAVQAATKVETATHYAQQKISPVLLEQYDRNRNGRLDPHEWERHRQDLNRLLAEPRQRPQPAPAAAAEPGK